MGSSTNFIDFLGGMFLELVSDALLWLVSSFSVKKLALIPIGAFFPVRTSLKIAISRFAFQKQVQSGTVSTQRIIWRHKPRKIEDNSL